MVVLLSLTHTVSVCVFVCVAAISMTVAAGHGKSSVLPLIVLITSLGAASPHTYWLLSIFWNRAPVTQSWWCHRAQGRTMGVRRAGEGGWGRAEAGET